jgi:hypothetical protein
VTVRTDTPPGPWLLVVGMHRSGTSAVTGSLGAMGFHVATSTDRMDWPESNPEHWESLSLALYNEDLLVRLHGGWNAPPDLLEGWEDSPEIRTAPEPAVALSSAYPGSGPSVWKDPRLCLLLPYWRKVLPASIAAVLVWRSPLAVARSLQRRDQLSIAEGLALWERYNRSAIAGLRHVDTYVVDYESVVDDPSGSVGELKGWLGSLDQFAGEEANWDVNGATAAIVGELHHQPGVHRGNDDTLLLPEQKDLVEYLSGSAGGHRPLLAQSPGHESPWTTSLLRLRLSNPNREFDAVKEELRLARDELRLTRAEAIRDLANMRASTSWRITRPLRSVVSTLEGMRSNPPDR